MDRYEYVSKIGAGSYGEVSLVKEKKDSKKCGFIIKIPSPAPLPEPNYLNIRTLCIKNVFILKRPNHSV